MTGVRAPFAVSVGRTMRTWMRSRVPSPSESTGVSTHAFSSIVPPDSDGCTPFVITGR